MAPGMMLGYARNVNASGGQAQALSDDNADHPSKKSDINEIRKKHGKRSVVPMGFDFRDPTSRPIRNQQDQAKCRQRDRYDSSLQETESSTRSASAQPGGRTANGLGAGYSIPPVRRPSTSAEPAIGDVLRSHAGESNIEGDAPQSMPDSDHPRPRDVAVNGYWGRREDMQRSYYEKGVEHHPQQPTQPPFSPSDIPDLSSAGEAPTADHLAPGGIDRVDGYGSAHTRPTESLAARPVSPIDSDDVEAGDQYAQQHRQYLNNEHRKYNEKQPQPSKTNTGATRPSGKAVRGLSEQQIRGFKLEALPHFVSDQPTPIPRNPITLQANATRPASAAPLPVPDHGHTTALPIHATSANIPSSNGRLDYQDPRLSAWEEHEEIVHIENDAADEDERPSHPHLEHREPSDFAQPDARTNAKRTPTLEQITTSKRSLDDTTIDYEWDELLKKTYPALREEPFDLDTSQEPSVFPQSVANNDLGTKLDAAIALPPDKRQHFLKTLSMIDWEEAGQWLMEQFHDVTSQLAESRQQRRMTAMVFEQEVSRRSDKVEKSITDLNDELKEMKEQGQLFMTPRKSRG